MLNIIQKENKLLIHVKIIPKSSRDSIKIEGDHLKVKITSPPVDGKANKHLISFLSKYFHITKSDIIIEQGLTSRKKVVSFKDIDPETILEKF